MNLTLHHPCGKTFSVPREWTDRADPDPLHFFSVTPPILSFAHLIQLSDFVRVLKQGKSKKA
jgi:hypothetical protein